MFPRKVDNDVHQAGTDAASSQLKNLCRMSCGGWDIFFHLDGVTQIEKGF